METKTEAEAIQLVTQRAEQVAQLIGNTQLRDASTEPGSCRGKFGESSDTIFSVQGVWVVEVPADKHHDVINRLRDTWKAHDYDITTDRFVGQGGNITGEDPDGWSIDVITTAEPDYMRLLIHTPCFESPTPR